MTVMSRQALFEAVWQRPLTDIAAEVGITDVGLRKLCDRHDIPTPGRGYWAQVRAGKIFPRPVLRPVSDPRKEQVLIAGGRSLPPAVAAAMKQARATADPKTRAKREKAPFVVREAEASEQGEPEGTGPPATTARKDLASTAKALSKAREDDDGFTRIAGGAVVPMRIGRLSHDAALGFLAALLSEADARGWRLEPDEGRAKLKIEGETVAFRIDEIADKVSHAPTPKELAVKARRDRWGGYSQPWPTWDLSPSGRLAFVVEENNWSGLRRTYSQRKGHPFAASLEAIVAGLAGHAAFKAERRREAEIRAREAAIAEARRQRLEAFQRREKRRAEFVDRVSEQLAERTRLSAVLAHLEAQPPDQRDLLADMEAWLRRRLKAVDAHLDPVSLETSTRHAKVAFAEPPPQTESERYWYAPDVELHIWKPDGEVMRSVAELDWGIGEGLIADPRAEPAADPSALLETSN